MLRRGALAALVVCAVASSAGATRAELDGVWILAGNAQVDTLRLTPAGEAARARYDHVKDDPDFRCIPASFTRVMHTPSPPIEIRQRAGAVEINYEFMDVRRHVPISTRLLAKNAPYTVAKYPHLGRSVGRYEGETLVVDTVGQRAGVLDTLGVPGLYQSDKMHTVERFTAEGNRMRVVVTHDDPVYFAAPMTVTFTYQRLPDGKIMEWGCVPEEASYDRFKTPAR